MEGSDTQDIAYSDAQILAKQPVYGITARTPRLLLRPTVFEDVPDIFLMRSDPEVARFTSFLPDADLSQTRHSLQSRLAQGNNFSFAVELAGLAAAKETDRPSTDDDFNKLPKVIGMCGGGKLPEIGYMFNRSYWGNGYATEALQGFLEVYWRTYPNGFPGLEGEERNYLYGSATTDNLASQTVLRKCGFEFWKDEEVDDKYDKDGKIKLYVYRLWRPGMGNPDVPRGGKEDMVR